MSPDDDNGDAPEENIPWHKKIMNAASKPTKSSGSFTREQLKATRVEGNKILSLLEEYYFGKEQTYKMLMTSWADTFDFDPMSTDPEKLASANKLVDTMARALVTDAQQTFLMGGIGSSSWPDMTIATMTAIKVRWNVFGSQCGRLRG